MTAADVLLIEAVHLAFGAREPALPSQAAKNAPEL